MKTEKKPREPYLNKKDAKRVLAMIWACDTAIRWFQQPGQTAQQAWERCDRIDWMLWLTRGLLSTEAHEQARMAAMHYGNEKRKCAAVRKAIPWATIRDAAIRELKRFGSDSPY